jgi:hypothetical protein
MEQKKQAAKLLLTLASIGFLCIIAIILIVADVDLVDLLQQEVDKTIEQEVIQEAAKMKKEGKEALLPKLLPKK